MNAPQSLRMPPLPLNNPSPRECLPGIMLTNDKFLKEIRMGNSTNANQCKMSLGAFMNTSSLCECPQSTVDKNRVIKEIYNGVHLHMAQS